MAEEYILTDENYYSDEANEKYMSFHTYLDYIGGFLIKGCEARAEALRKKEWEEPKPQAFLIGSYVDEALTGSPESFADFKIKHPEIFTQKGTLRAEFKMAEKMIERCKSDDFFMKTLSGEHQKIMTGYWGGCEWKIKMDSYIPNVGIFDLKTTANLHKAWNIADYGWVSFCEAFNYPGQLALYQKIVEINTGKKLPCYISAVTKEEYPEIAVIAIDQMTLDNALNHIEMNLPSVLMVRNGEVEPIRCEHCNYCRTTKKLTGAISMQDLIEE